MGKFSAKTWYKKKLKTLMNKHRELENIMYYLWGVGWGGACSNGSYLNLSLEETVPIKLMKRYDHFSN